MQAYTRTARILHWLTAAILFGLLAVGFYMEAMSFSPFKLDLYAWHKSFGLLILLLLGVRLVWRFWHPPPATPKTHTKFEKVAAKSVHALFYVLLFAFPLSGWIMSSAGEFPVTFFGFPVPDLIGKDEYIFEISREVHEILAYTLLALIGLHLAGALKHHIIDQDTTLMRMTHTDSPAGNITVIFIVLAGFALIAAGYIIPRLEKYTGGAASEVTRTQTASAANNMRTGSSEPARVPAWQIVPSESAIRFTVRQSGQDFTGEFENFKADIFFDPENLENSFARVDIDISSLRTGSPDRDQQALQDKWFNENAYPQALFETRRITSTGPQTYLAEADLRIKDTVQTVELPFTLTISKANGDVKVAEMKGQMQLDRLQWNIGTGQWEDSGAISHQIDLEIRVKALCCQNSRAE